MRIAVVLRLCASAEQDLTRASALPVKKGATGKVVVSTRMNVKVSHIKASPVAESAPHTTVVVGAPLAIEWSLVASRY